MVKKMPKTEARKKAEEALAWVKLSDKHDYYPSQLSGCLLYTSIRECGLTSSPLSDALSRNLKKRGMSFVGTTILYSYLQAVGVIFSHEEPCFLAPCFPQTPRP